MVANFLYLMHWLVHAPYFAHARFHRCAPITIFLGRYLCVSMQCARLPTPGSVVRLLQALIKSPYISKEGLEQNRSQAKGTVDKLLVDKHSARRNMKHRTYDNGETIAGWEKGWGQYGLNKESDYTSKTIQAHMFTLNSGTLTAVAFSSV